MRRWLRRKRAREIHEEVESHLEMRAEWNQREGMSPEQARAAARRQLGNAALLEEDVRRVYALPWFQTIGQDVRYALRGFRRSPAFTVAAVLTIALGIGASSAVFSVVDRILFRPLPYPDAGRLVSFGMVAPSADKNEFLIAENYVRLRARQTPFTSFTSFGFISPCDLTEQNAARLRCAMVESTFLPTFGIQPMLGRNFAKEEDRPNSPKVALLSYGFWKSRFLGDRETIGRSILVDGRPTAIIGILPPGFELFNLTPFDLLIPEAIDEAHPGNGRAFRVFARLKPGVSLEQAREAMQPLFEDELRTIPPEFRGEVRMVIRPLRDRQIADVRTASWTLFGAVLVVLLIACGNVANLMLARSASRRRELAIRAAIGASRGRLLRQSVTESLLLAGLGALAGCGLAWVLIRFFVAVAPQGITRLDQAGLDSRVLLFAIALSIASGILFGLAAVVESPPAGTLAEGRAFVSSRGLLRHVLIAAQIAASLILLSGASLLLRSLWNLEKVPLGMDTDHAVAAHFVLGGAYESETRWRTFFDNLETRLQRLPGGAAYGITDSVPPFGGTRSSPYFVINVEGRPPYPQGAGGMVGWRYVTPGYFAALRIPIVRGRAFTEQERDAPEMPIILSQTLARRLFPNDDAVGKHVLRTGSGEWHTVVGVAGDVRNNGLGEQAGPEYYVLRKHVPDDTFRNRAPGGGWRAATVIVRSPFQPQAVAALLRSTILELEPAVPVTTETMRERAAQLTVRPRFNALVLGGFAGAGLLLAAIGIYGVIAFLVSQRTREVGVRMALGATPSTVSKLFLRHTAAWTAAGTVAGLAGALAATNMMGTMLFRVNAHDPLSLFAAPAILFVVALAAAWAPSRRAAHIDPVATLREE